MGTLMFSHLQSCISCLEPDLSTPELLGNTQQKLNQRLMGATTICVMWPYPASSRTLQFPPLYRDYPSKYCLCFPVTSFMSLNPSSPTTSTFPLRKSSPLPHPTGFSRSKTKIPPPNFNPRSLTRIFYSPVCL